LIEVHTPGCRDVEALWSGIVDAIKANGCQPSVVVTAAAATPDRVSVRVTATKGMWPTSTKASIFATVMSTVRDVRFVAPGSE